MVKNFEQPTSKPETIQNIANNKEDVGVTKSPHTFIIQQKTQNDLKSEESINKQKKVFINVHYQNEIKLEHSGGVLNFHYA